jgi:hypothetical protein
MNATPAEHDAEWPLRCEISRLTTKVNSLTAQLKHQLVRANSHASSATRSSRRMEELQRVIVKYKNRRIYSI